MAKRSLSRLLCLVVFACCTTAAAADSASTRWILVDTDALTLAVMEGEAELALFDNIAIGSNGTTRDKRRGDEKTPLGEFRVTEVRDSVRFVTFIAFSYPTNAQALQACNGEHIPEADCARLLRARERREPMPQDTALGGHLGVHGIGDGDPAVHELLNWTNGCIALTNEQLAHLVDWVVPGMRVSVR